MNINKKAFKDAENENIYTLELYKNSTTGNIEYRSPKGVIIKVADKDGLESLESAVTSLQSAVDALPAAPTTTVVDISSAQILSMGSSSIELLPAPGAGKYYDIEKIILEYTFGTIPYTFNNYISIRSSGGDAIAIISNILSGTENKVKVSRLNGENIDIGPNLNSFDTAESLNSAINIDTWSGANPTLGDGTMRAIITYTLRTFGA